MKKTKKEVKTKDIFEKLAKELLDLIGSNAKLEVKEDEEIFYLNINADDETGLLIGRHGETINSLQTVLSLAMRQKTGIWKRIVVNVGDWREKEESKLQNLAKQAAQRAIETGEAQPIYNLTPPQRRVIHLALSEDKEVETESLGEGKDRYLLVKPKKAK